MEMIFIFSVYIGILHFDMFLGIFVFKVSNK